MHLWHLATIMGTSVTQLEDTYARWLKRTDDQLRATFDTYDSREIAAERVNEQRGADQGDKAVR